MNRTIKDATVKVSHYDDLQSLKAHVLAFVTDYNFAKHSKALRCKTPFQTICHAWTKIRTASRSTRTTSFRDHTPTSERKVRDIKHHALTSSRNFVLPRW